MDDLLLIEAVERYLKGEMSPKERTFFEEIRKNDPSIDQMVVEQTFLFHELDKQAGIRAFKHSLHEVENKLTDEGFISRTSLKGKAKVIFLWKKYKRNIAVAASIAGLVSLVTTGLIITYNNKVGNNNITELVGVVKDTKKEVTDTKKEIKKLKDSIEAGNKIKEALPNPGYRATGFLVDGKGYIITNAHVVNRMKNIYVQNNKGEYFKAVVVHTDPRADLAILKIKDSEFRTISNLPYSIKKGGSDLGEQIFTLGYPRNEIVYGEGYLSAKSGNEGDSTAYQISVSVNPGNSGGPVLNKNGEIIGIITSKNSIADGVVFATKSKNIFKLLDAAEKADTALNIKLPANTSLKGLDRTQQVKKLEDFVFMVVGN